LRPLSGAATVGVVGVRTPQTFKLGVCDTPKKLTGNITRSAVGLLLAECGLLSMDALYRILKGLRRWNWTRSLH